MTRYRRREPTETDVEEREHAHAKRRAAVVGEDCARDRIYDAIARFCNPAAHGEPSDLDRWILLHMSDADIFDIHGGGRFMKAIRTARDTIAGELVAAGEVGYTWDSADSLNNSPGLTV